MMEGSHHVNQNSITYRKGAVQRTEIERPFLAATGIISNVEVCFLTGTISHVHGCAPKKWLCIHENLLTKSYDS